MQSSGLASPDPAHCRNAPLGAGVRATNVTRSVREQGAAEALATTQTLLLLCLPVCVGAMIAAWFAITHRERVGKIVISTGLLVASPEDCKDDIDRVTERRSRPASDGHIPGAVFRVGCRRRRARARLA
jgi:hypothetical protein